MRVPLPWLAEYVELPPGTTGAQVAAVLSDERTDDLLALTEPDFTDGRLPW